VGDIWLPRRSRRAATWMPNTSSAAGVFCSRAPPPPAAYGLLVDVSSVLPTSVPTLACPRRGLQLANQVPHPCSNGDKPCDCTAKTSVHLTDARE